MSYKFIPILVIFEIVFMRQLMAQHKFNDSMPNVKIVKEDTNIVCPVLENPSEFCKKIEDSWNKHLATSSNSELDFIKDANSNYYASFNFTITKNGAVSKFGNKSYYSGLDSICNNVFYPVIYGTKWVPAYNKVRGGMQCIATTVTAYVELNNKRLISFRFKDLKTKKDFYHCF